MGCCPCDADRADGLRSFGIHQMCIRDSSYAGETRKSIEADTGRSIITSENAVQLNTVVTDMIEGVVNAEDKEGENKK